MSTMSRSGLTDVYAAVLPDFPYLRQSVRRDDQTILMQHN